MSNLTGFRKNLVIPLYCSRCGKFNFLYHLLEGKQVRIIESLEPPWREHPCAQFGGSEFWDNFYISKLKEISWGEKRIPFKRRKKGKVKFRKKYYSGVILSIEPGENNAVRLRVINDEEDILEINYSGSMQEVCAGMLIDLKNMVPVAGDVFRLPELVQIQVEKDFSSTSATMGEFYELYIRGNDQEKLENYINKLVGRVKKDKGKILAVIPLPLSKKEEDKEFARKIIFLGQDQIIATLQELSLPEGFDASFAQQKTG